MAEIVIIACDSCGKEHKDRGAKGFISVSTAGAADIHFRVVSNKETVVGKTVRRLDVCGTKCLLDWLGNNAK